MIFRPPSRNRTLRALAAALLGGWAGLGQLGVSSARPAPPPGRAAPAPDCRRHVGYDRDAVLLGYLLGSPAVCVPFTTTAITPPPGYAGDFYVAEFSERKLEARWLDCKADGGCRARIERQMSRRLPPLKQTARSTGALDPSGAIDWRGDVDLRQVRRPAVFGRGEHPEAIAGAEARTYTVEFAAPPDTYESMTLHVRTAVKLRGWYLKGRGIDDGRGSVVRALVIMSNGGGGQMTALNDPADHAYHVDAGTGESVPNHYPNATSEAVGQRLWRQYLYDLNQAGFDVLTFDRRGEGISSGLIDVNTLQQGRDLLAVIDQLESGRGLRVLTPDGRVTQGRRAARDALTGARAARMPILLGGYSRGSMAVGWAMTMNFARACNYDRSVPRCAPPRLRRNIRGALLIASFVSGAGYLPVSTKPDDQDRNLLAGGLAGANIIFFPGSEILASIDKWPAAFFARGLWDSAESLEGTVAAYDRVTGLKDIMVVRGPHAIESWPREEQRRLSERMILFARAAAVGHTSLPRADHWSDVRGLVATTPDVWEPSSAPQR